MTYTEFKNKYLGKGIEKGVLWYNDICTKKV